jgi:hypothetical protein
MTRSSPLSSTNGRSNEIVHALTLQWSRRRSVAVVLITGVAIALTVGAYRASIGSSGGNPTNPSPTAGTYADLSGSVAAINHARDANDALTPAVAATVAKLSDELPANAAQASKKVFTAGISGPVYVVPAKDGFALVTAGGGGIIPGRLSDSNPVAGGAVYTTGSPGWLFGIAEDNVTSIDVLVGSSSYKASLVHNGYYWVAPSSDVDVRSASLVVHLKSGAVVKA